MGIKYLILFLFELVVLRIVNHGQTREEDPFEFCEIEYSLTCHENIIQYPLPHIVSVQSGLAPLNQSRIQNLV